MPGVARHLLLYFASPKERSQRKGDPGSSFFETIKLFQKIPCATRIDRPLRNSSRELFLGIWHTPRRAPQTVLAETSCRFSVARRLSRDGRHLGITSRLGILTRSIVRDLLFQVSERRLGKFCLPNISGYLIDIADLKGIVGQMKLAQPTTCDSLKRRASARV